MIISPVLILDGGLFMSPLDLRQFFVGPYLVN